MQSPQQIVRFVAQFRPCLTKCRNLMKAICQQRATEAGKRNRWKSFRRNGEPDGETADGGCGRPQSMKLCEIFQSSLKPVKRRLYDVANYLPSLIWRILHVVYKLSNCRPLGGDTVSFVCKDLR